MRLGLSTDFGAKCATEWIGCIKEIGCKAAVFPLDCRASDETVSQYVKAASENDVVIAEVGVWRNTMSADPAERKAMMKYAVEQLALAERIGARCCVNVAGTSHGPRWDGGYKGNFSKETRKEIVSMVRTIIDEVNPKKTKFTLEPMPWMVPTSPDDYLRLIDEVDRDGFGVHLDLINMVTSPERYFFLDEFMDEAFEKLGGRILSCHLKDVKLLEEYTFRLAECACGEGILDVKRYMNKASAIDKDMPMIIEHLHNDDEYKRSFKYVTDL